MGLSFLVPAFLLGLAALAIPIWVHLRNRPKQETVDFPSLMFLEQIPYRAVQKQQLRHRALFALRCLALALLAIAFARPFLGAVTPAAATVDGAREVVVALDRSWSMGYGDRWGRALEAARQTIGALAGSDRASLVLFDREAEVRLRSVADGAAAIAALESVGLSEATTDLAAGLRGAREILAESTLPVREVVLISDFQRLGWDSESDIEMPEGTVVRPITVVETAPVNVSVAGVAIDRLLDPTDGSERLRVTARLARIGEGSSALTARLEVDGLDPQRRPVELVGNAAAVVEFDPIPLASESLAGTVRIDADELPGDDVFHFQVAPDQALSVLLLDNPRSADADSVYVRRALEIGSRPAFRIERALLGDLDPASLARRDLVILNDPGALDAGNATALLGWVDAGGGLVVALGELTEELGALAGEGAPLPEEISTVDRAADLGGTLAYADPDHPVFEIFAAPGSGDLAAARFFRYHDLSEAGDEGVIARFDDGVPALLERSVGEGRLLVWTSSLDTFWNDLPLRPVYLPFIQRLARHAAEFREPRAWLEAARPWNAADLLSSVGESVGSAREVSVDGESVSEQRGIRLSPGHHLLRWSGDEGERTAPLAINLDRAESDLGSVDPEEVAAAVVWRRGGTVEADQETTPAADVERSQSIWWYLVMVAFALLAAETALSNRLSSNTS